MKNIRPENKTVTLVASLVLALAGATGCSAAVDSDEAGEAVESVAQASSVLHNQLTRGEKLASGSLLTSPDGRVLFSMQGDGNLVLYFSPFGSYVWTQAIWASNTAGHPGAWAIMQNDGNFVVYDTNGSPLWATATGPNGSFVSVQSDGNLVVYNAGGSPLWSSNTAPSVPPPSMCLNEPSNNAYFCPAGSWWQSCDAPTQPNSGSATIAVSCAGPKVNTGICTPDSADPFKWTCKYETEWVENTFTGCPGETQTAWNDKGALKYTASPWCP